MTIIEIGFYARFWRHRPDSQASLSAAFSVNVPAQPSSLNCSDSVLPGTLRGGQAFSVTLRLSLNVCQEVPVTR